MSYLNTLVLRSVEQPQPIRPRLASLFEPVAGARGPSIKTTSTRIPSRISRSLGDSSHSRAMKPQTRIMESAEDRPATGVVMKSAAGGEIETEPVMPKDQQPDRVANKSLPKQLPAQAPDLTGKAHRKATRRNPIAGAETIKIADVTPQLVPTRQDLRVNEQDLPVNEQDWTAGDRTRPEILVTETRETKLIEKLIQAESESKLRPEIGSAKPGPQGASLMVKPQVAADRRPVPSITPDTPESSSSIRITIGRVEVRAIMPEAPSAPPESSQARAYRPLALDQYLKKRNGEIS